MTMKLLSSHWKHKMSKSNHWASFMSTNILLFNTYLFIVTFLKVGYHEEKEQFNTFWIFIILEVNAAVSDSRFLQELHQTNCTFHVVDSDFFIRGCRKCVYILLKRIFKINWYHMYLLHFIFVESIYEQNVMKFI